MNAAIVLAVAISIFFLGYRFYSKFIANRILCIDSGRVTPAVQVNDGKDYIPHKKKRCILLSLRYYCWGWCSHWSDIGSWVWMVTMYHMDTRMSRL